VVHRFFRDEQFDFEIKTALGGVYYGCGDVGEILAAAAAIRDGDDESWSAQWNALAARVRAIAESCARDGRRVSAREAFLRAAAYCANTFNVILRNPRLDDELLPAFTAHRQCFDEFCALSDTPVDRLEIPYAGTTMPAYLMQPDASGGPHPVLLVTNGSDGPITWAYSAGAAGALRRGYAVLLYDGPGQQSMLFQKKTCFRPDWEAVIGPVIDVLERRADVDPAAIVLLGTSQAGFWVTRAAAFEHRAAAAVADPGVVDVSTSWLEHLPSVMKTQLTEGRQKEFDRNMKIGMMFSRDQRATFAFRARPYGTTDAYEVYRQVIRYRLDPDTVSAIACPVLVTDPEGEQFWPGQSQQLYDMLPGAKEIVRFTAAEGADLHCQPMGRSLTDQRVFDWLDATLRRP
jgi:hypothetical protein